MDKPDDETRRLFGLVSNVRYDRNTDSIIPEFRNERDREEFAAGVKQKGFQSIENFFEAARMEAAFHESDSEE